VGKVGGNFGGNSARSLAAMDNEILAGIMPAPGGPRLVSPTLQCWMRDWAAWSRTRQAQTAVNRWQAASSLMAPLTDADRVVDGCGADSSVEAALADQRLLFLVQRAVDRDADAARVVMERMMPALVSKASAHARRSRRKLDAVYAELISAAWIVITTYPVERRPAKIWINVLLDTEQAVFGRPRLADRSTVPMSSPLLADHTLPILADYRDPLEELLELLAAARRAGLSPAYLQLLVDLGVHGMSTQQIGDRDGVTDRAVRTRRARAIRALTILLDIPNPNPNHSSPPPARQLTATPAGGRQPVLAGAA